MDTNLCNNTECTLCMACISVCPKDAIYLSVDEFGYENISINDDKCINCGLCAGVCRRRESVNRKAPELSFAAQAKDKNKIKNSASGGAFQTIARYVLDNNGVCYGAEGYFDNGKYVTKHTRVDSNNDLHRILNTKYVPSYVLTSYKQAKQDLDGNRFVLFSGTPCQIQGLKAYLNKDYDNLITVDLICHGVTSQKMFNDYLSVVEAREDITIIDYQFRDKSISWGLNFRYSFYKNSKDSSDIKVKHCPREESSYIVNYLKRNIFRENCYNCSLACAERVSDFTLGDFWEIETEHPEFIVKSKPAMSLKLGISCVFANTNKACELCDILKSEMIMHQVEFGSVAKHNDCLNNSSSKGKKRDVVLQTYRDYGYKAVDEQYRKSNNKALIYKIKNNLKSRLPDSIRIFIYKTPFLRKIVFH